MLALLPLIQKLLLDYMTKKTHGHGFSLNFQGIALMLFTGILAFLVALFLLFALQEFLAVSYGVPISWLLTAGVTFVVMTIAYCWAAYSKRTKGLINRIKEEVKEDLSPLAQIVETLAEPVKDHPIASVVLAALAGVMAGDKLHGNEGTDS